VDRLNQNGKRKPWLGNGLVTGGIRFVYISPAGKVVRIDGPTGTYETFDGAGGVQVPDHVEPRHHFLKKVITEATGREPEDWDAAIQTPALPTFERIYGRLDPSTQTFAVTVRSDYAPYMGLKGMETVSISQEETKAMFPAELSSGKQIEIPMAFWVKLAKLMYRRGLPFIRLKDSSATGTLTAEITGISGHQLSGKISGKLSVDFSELEETPNPRRYIDANGVVYDLVGDWIYDRDQGRFTSFRMVTLKDAYRGSRLDVAVELISESK